LKIIEVIWFDAQSSLKHINKQQAIENLKPRTTKSVGYLVKEEKNYLLLAFMKFDDDSFKHWQVIPKGMIKSKKIIKNE